MAQHLYRFGPYSLDTGERVLRRGDEPVALPPKDLETLIVLLERAGHIVDKEELLQKVWPGVFIEEGNLSRRVFNLRQVLGDGDGQKYIETIPRRGYRFVASLLEEFEPATSEKTSSPADVAGPHPSTPMPRRQPRTLWLWGLAVAISLAVMFLWASKRFSRAEPAPSQKVMLAVLPFTNMSGDTSNDYFADGFTEEMIAQLGQVQPARLGVIARTSAMTYKNTHSTAAQISRELGVNFLLEGSVRQSGDRVRITAQLIQASDQTHLWAESYDTPLTDILQVQREIGRKITDSLRLELLHSQSVKREDAHLDPEAYRKYLLGVNEFRKGTREGQAKAMQYLKEAIAAEPSNARYHSALAEVYDGSVPYYLAPSVAGPLLQKEAQAALSLDPGLANAHAMLGDHYLLYDWNWKDAEDEYHRALDLNPSSPDALLGFADYLSTLGRHDEALAQVQRIYKIDPLAAEYRMETLWVYFFSGRMEETVTQAQKTIELNPQAGYAYALEALAYSQMGRRNEAVEAAETAARITDSPGVIVVSVSALARVGETAKARQMLHRAVEMSKTRYVCRFLLAAAYVDLGENDNAFASLERGIREKST